MIELDTHLFKGHKIETLWNGKTLWNKGDSYNGLAILDNGQWTVVMDTIDNSYHFYGKKSKEDLLEADPNWQKAFDKIDNGLVPDYGRNKNSKSNCSCGAHAVFGKDFEGHGSNCLITNPNIDSVKNNDGRESCHVCSEPITHVAGYQLCRNKSCSWYDR